MNETNSIETINETNLTDHIKWNKQNWKLFKSRN